MKFRLFIGSILAIVGISCIDREEITIYLPYSQDASASGVVGNPGSSSGIHPIEGGVTDNGDVTDAGIPADGGSIVIDSGSDNNDCVSMVQHPLGPRLNGRYCVNSAGKETLIDYYDTQLEIFCDWKSASDQVTRCMPDSIQGGFEYADPGCYDPSRMGFAEVDEAGNLTSKYISIENEKDGSIDVYLISRPYKGGDDYYYRSEDGDGGYVCWDTTGSELGNRHLFFVGSVVDPTIFVPIK